MQGRIKSIKLLDKCYIACKITGYIFSTSERYEQWNSEHGHDMDLTKQEQVHDMNPGIQNMVIIWTLQNSTSSPCRPCIPFHKSSKVQNLS